MFLNIASANQELFSEVKKAIAMMESGDKYNIVNRNGFMGKYQFGAMSLVDLGIINKEKYKAQTYTMPTKTRKAKVMWRNGLTLNSFLSDSSNWNIQSGKDGFLNSPELQEQTMNRVLNKNYTTLTNMGFDMRNLALAKSLLMAAHFGGITSAINYANNGTEYKDAFGTKISKYYGNNDNINTKKKVVFKFKD
jgi:hypothetical protein